MYPITKRPTGHQPHPPNKYRRNSTTTGQYRANQYSFGTKHRRHSTKLGKYAKVLPPIPADKPSVHNGAAAEECDEMDWTKQFDQQRVFVSYEGERKKFEVATKDSIKELKERARHEFNIPPDETPDGMELQDQNILTLIYAGAQLSDHWTLADVGVPNAATLKAGFTLEEKPTMYVYCVFNEELITVLEKMDVKKTTGAIVRGIVSRLVGLPVTVFRLCAQDGQELYDGVPIHDYGVQLRDTLRLEVWDGWKEFLNLCIMGFTRHVMAHLSTDDEVLARFQQKVAMYIAAHFAHVDLAVTLLKQGIRADEPIGEHPSRQWCKHQHIHVDALKAPIHEAAEAGSLSVLRSFVHNNVCSVLAKDGNDLAPLNLALRRKRKSCASFLLTKQWNKINYSKKDSVHLSIYVKMKRWAERSRSKVLMIYGQWKSSIKHPKRHVQIGGLLGQGVQLDGFSKSRMTTKAEAEHQKDLDEERARKERLYANPIPPPMDPDVYFRSMRRIQNANLPKLTKFSNMLQRGRRESMSGNTHAPLSRKQSMNEMKVPLSRKQSMNEIKVPPRTHKESFIENPPKSRKDDASDPKPAPPPPAPTAASCKNSGVDRKTTEKPSHDSTTHHQNISQKPRKNSAKEHSGHPLLRKESESDMSEVPSDAEDGVDDGFDTRNKVYRPRSNSHSGVRLPPITEKTKTKEMSASQQNLSTLNLDDPEFSKGRKSKQTEAKSDTKKHQRSILKHTKSQISLGDRIKSSRESDITEEDESPRRQKKRDPTSHSPVPLAKVTMEGASIPLSMNVTDGVARPFINHTGEALTKRTLDIYEKYRGLGSRDYAIKCLTVATSFTEKPWLQQVQQALTISKQGVNKALSKEAHLFSPRADAKDKLPNGVLMKKMDDGNAQAAAMVSV